MGLALAFLHGNADAKPKSMDLSDSGYRNDP